MPSRPQISEPLRQAVIQRAQSRCEYCQLPQESALARHHIDHVIPLKHGGETSIENLALACVFCNRHKASDIVGIHPESGDIVRLFDPRTQDWQEHFENQNGVIRGKTKVGVVTVRVLRMNLVDVVVLRRLASR